MWNACSCSNCSRNGLRPIEFTSPSWPSGYLAPKREVADSSLFWIPIIRLAWSLYKCAVLWRAAFGISATERPSGIIREEKVFFSRCQVVAIWPMLLKAT